MGTFTDTVLDKVKDKHPPLKDMLKNNSSYIAPGHNTDRLIDKWGDWEVMDFCGFDITSGDQIGQLIYFLLRKKSIIITMSTKASESNGTLYVNIRSDNSGVISYSKESSDYSGAKQVYDWSVKKAEEVSGRLGIIKDNALTESPVVH